MGYDAVWLETRPHILGFRNTGLRHTQDIGNTASSSICQEHGVVFNLSETRRYI